MAMAVAIASLFDLLVLVLQTSIGHTHGARASFSASNAASLKIAPSEWLYKNGNNSTPLTG
jgi:hypothetical protein